MSQETLDVRSSLQLVRRHKIVVGAFAALGLLAGAGLVLHRPPMLSSETLVEVLLSPSAQAVASQAGSTASNPALATAFVDQCANFRSGASQNTFIKRSSAGR